MSDNREFVTQLLTAIEEKTQWYDNTELPHLLDEYRSLQAHVGNLTQALLKKASITADPYKHEKKISDIELINDSPFNDNERAVIIGSRLSDYDNMLDFICNYMKFSVETITVDRIKKLIMLNSTFTWNSLQISSTKPNTRALAELLQSIRMGGDPITTSVVNDSVSQAGKSITKINLVLKNLSDFKKEVYKAEVRKNITCDSRYPLNENPNAPRGVLIDYIKHNFASAMKHQPYYTELIEEILKEDIGEYKEKAREEVLAKLAVKQETAKKKERKINPKDCLVEGIKTLAASTPQLDQVLSKLQDNKNLLESEHNSLWEKFKAAWRKAFGMNEKPVTYKITITDQLSQTQKQEIISYQHFVNAIDKRARYYETLATKSSLQFQKLQKLTDDKIVDFLTRQISECQHLLVELNALDEYFKTTVEPLNRSKVKGIKMEITSLKNTIVKANQRKADYSAYIEEQAQLRKLGILND